MQPSLPSLVLPRAALPALLGLFSSAGASPPSSTPSPSTAAPSSSPMFTGLFYPESGREMLLADPPNDVFMFRYIAQVYVCDVILSGKRVIHIGR